MQSLKPGMPKAQVLNVLSREASSYHIDSVEPRYCGRGGALAQTELVYLQCNWWYPSDVLLMMCYDDSGTLTYFQFIDQ